MHNHLDSNNPKETTVVQRAISDYVSAMSHDLKTPLVAIVGIGEILKNELKDPEHQKLLSTLTQATNTVLSLVKDILSLTRTDADHLQVLFEPFDLLRLIEGVVSTMSHQCLEKGVELLISYPSSLPRIVVSDSSALRRIIINLLSNAIKFTEHGHILIKVREEYHHDKEIRLSITVKDTGIGIPEDCLNPALQDASKLNPNDEQKYQGAPLTIAIIRRLLQGMNGEMQLRNKNGEGAEFVCSIPFALKNPNPHYLATKEDKLSPFKVLIISNNPSSSQILEEMFEEECVQVCSSSNCLKILKNSYSSEEIYDIVLVDDRFMNLTLLSIAHKAKKEKWTSKTLFIYSSFPLSLTQMDQVRTAGFHDIISKPILPSQFIEHIELAWRKHILEHAEVILENIESGTTSKNNLNLTRHNKNIAKSHNILLVEDNPVAGNITQCILESLNCQVDWVENGVEALRLCKISHYDLIFLDIDLPDIDGITICRILRTQSGLNQESIIIVLSGQIAQKEAGACLAAGMNAFLEKPASSSHFKHIIQQFLTNEQKSAA